MAQLPITDSLEAKFQRVAAQYGLSLARFLEKVADEYWVEAPKPAEVSQPSRTDDEETVEQAVTKHEAIIAKEQATYERQHPELCVRYAGEYIAMHNGDVVDHDVDRIALRKRIRKSFGNQSVFVTPVLEEPVQVIHVRGLRLQTNQGKSLQND